MHTFFLGSDKVICRVAWLTNRSVLSGFYFSYFNNNGDNVE